MTLTEKVQLWQERVQDPTLAQQLQDLVQSGDKEALSDAFYRDLEFGTAGLRGVLGPGTNRMNIYTVGQATQGLVNYLNSLPGEGKSLAICYDSRINSRLFAEVAAEVAAANGVHAYIYPRLEPTPALSFATRYLHCDAGINVTASHNPAEYNGYKVYGPDGCQITSQMAVDIQNAINEVDAFDSVKRVSFQSALSEGLVSYISEEVLDAFLAAVADQSVAEPGDESSELDVVYTPLNGTGMECVGRILQTIGVTEVTVVPEQKDPDGNFPTCTYPNPENRDALQLGIDLCEQVHPDLLLATDPDADRVGIAVEHEGEYYLPSGNEVGVLLLDYVGRVRSANGTMPANPVAVSTIVSTDMIDKVCAKYGIELRRVLTGFKYIGEVIAELEDADRVQDFVFGFEESYGYLSGPHVRDKDAVNASMLICQMARYYRARGKNLVQALEDLYEEHGYYRNKTISVTFAGEAGAQAMSDLMAGLRADAPAEIGGHKVVQVVDYAEGVNGLPSANVLSFVLEGDLKVMFRPSGTEPKVKAYVFANGATAQVAQDLCDGLAAAAQGIMKGE